MSGFNQPPADEPEQPAQHPDPAGSPADEIVAEQAAASANPQVSDERLADMSRDELAALGAQIDHVKVVSSDYAYEPGSKAERGAERRVALCFGLAALFGLLFVVAYLFWPWEVNATPPTEKSLALYYTPILGATLGGSLLFLGAGLVIWAKKLMPHEVSVQERHEGASSEVDRQTTAATLMQGADALGVGQRKVLRRSLLAAGGALGLAGIIPLGGLIKNPYKNNELYFTAWEADMRLVRANGSPVRPGDMEPGSMETVYPPVPGAIHMEDAATMLIRMHHDQAEVFQARPINQGTKKNGGQARWNEYVAYSKICSHLGCPVSLYEQETGRILCPCHQSQFDIAKDAKPVFGPATRSLAALPITVDDEGYFIAKSDYREAVGPAFWDRERRPADDDKQ